ncbi:ABC transporter permease [Actinomyces sp. B33]|uniref:ABC transporter permease n=1 Tax=Actinomyces sp. B33 TaxID=2942131 RepID=UPI00233FED5F|nr:ABC transporter permease [Actinomyces sp. B33]MDC4232282.1 ABC transporter permease [Actinomyces sp. B33]
MRAPSPVERWRRARIPLKIARRSLLRHRSRSLLAIIVIALPIVLTISSILLWHGLQSPRYVASRWLGSDPSVQAVASRLSERPVSQDATGQAVVSDATGAAAPLDEEELRRWAPVADAVLAVDVLHRVTVRSRSRAAAAVVETAIQTGSLDAPRVDLEGLSGAIGAGEAVITADLASQLAVGVGDAVDLSLVVDGSGTPDEIRGRATITRIHPGRARTLVVGDGTLDIDRSAVARATYTSWFVVGLTPIGWEDVRRLNASGYVVVSRGVLAEPPGADELPDAVVAYGPPDDGAPAQGWQRLLLVSGVLLVLMEIVLLVSPLFTVAQRSAMRTAALLFANGGDRVDQRRLMIDYGLLIGAAAGIVSLAASVLARAGIGSFLGLGASILPVWPLAPAGALPLLLALVASLSPARSASSIDSAAVISGRTWVPSRLVKRQIGYPLALLTALPLLVAAALTGWIWILCIGVALLEAGLIGSLPFAMTRWGGRGERRAMSLRLALRDAVRNGHRTFPAMASILTVVFVASALLIALTSSNEAAWRSVAHHGQRGQVVVAAVDPMEDPARMVAVQDRAALAVAARSPITSEATMRGMTWGSQGSGAPVAVEALSAEGREPVTLSMRAPAMAEQDLAYLVDDGSYLVAAGLVDGGDMVEAVTTLEQGGVLVPEAHLIDAFGRARIRSLDLAPLVDPGAGESPDVAGAEVIAFDSFPAALLDSLNVVVLSPQAAHTLKAPARPLGRLLTLESPVGVIGASGFENAVSAEVPAAAVDVVQPSVGSALVPYIAALIAVVAAMATVALVVVLSSSDMRPDLDTLDAIGAAPALRRWVTSAQGVLLSLTCIPLAVLSGLVTGVLGVLALERSGTFPDLSPLVPIVPWGALGGLLVGMPILSGLVAVLFTPRRQERLRPAD